MVSKRRGEKSEKRSDFLTVGEAAAQLDVTPATLRNWDKAGKLKAHRHPVNSYRLYRTEDIEAIKNAIRGTEN